MSRYRGTIADPDSIGQMHDRGLARAIHRHCDTFIKNAVLNGDRSVLNSDTAIINGTEYRVGSQCRSKINALN